MTDAGPSVWDPAAAQRRIVDARGIPGPYAPSSLPGYASQHGNSFAGVACADSDNPVDERAWVAAGNRADRVSPWFGKPWTWASGVCASWPESTKEDRFTGPFATTTSAPVLVVGNTYDPATPLHGARAVNRLLDGSRLLVMDGWGHGAIGSGPCIEEAYGAYLVDGTLPPAGTVCQPGGRAVPALRSQGPSVLTVVTPRRSVRRFPEDAGATGRVGVGETCHSSWTSTTWTGA